MLWDIGFTGRMLAGLAVIVVVLFALQLLARGGWRTRLTGADRRLMTVVDTLALPNAATLHVVRIAGRYMIVGRSGTQIANLGDLTAADVEGWLAAAPAATPVQTSSSPLQRLAVQSWRRHG